MTKHKFETEVSQLLHLIIHSLYSNKEIFLRELISNASDALDKLKHLTLVDDKYKDLKFDPRIDITFDQVARTLTVKDSGLGMDQTDLSEQIGTIASSGTRKFIEQLTGDSKSDSNLIGQFGVGFYSSFMVADFVEITSRKATEDSAWLWSSNGQGEYEINEAERPNHGTTVELRLNQAGQEFLNRYSLESIIKKYSNHISFPIYLHYEDTRFEGEGEQRKEIKEPKVEQVNDAGALWKRPKSKIEEKDYFEFYKSISYDNEDPLLYTHTNAEGTIEYSTLFFIPKKAPADMYYANYRPGVKLYVKRVFITDDDKELLPTWLRFVHGIIDAEDLPLNVSREILQQNPVLSRIRKSSVKKILDKISKLSENETDYAAFYDEFGRPLKEGLFQDFENRDKLLELVRFKSTKAEGYTSLDKYKESMPEDQKAIYYITGNSEQDLRESPLLEAYNKNDVEVLLMFDEVDEIVIPSIGKFKDIEFKSINRSDAVEDLKSEEDKEAEKKIEPLISKIKESLGNVVKDVKASTRLSDSPSCLVVDENDPTIQMQSILKTLGQDGLSKVKPILEINPTHEIVLKMENLDDQEMFADVSQLLFEQAKLIEGVKIDNPAGFVKRLNTFLAKAL
jgi:molecular chaperone HtpG